MAVAALGHPAYAAMNVQGFGAGVGRVGAVLRAGQLVPRRRGADALHRLALRRAEPGAADVPGEHVAGGPRPASQSFDLAQQHAAGRLGEGAVAPADAGHPQGDRRPERHLRRRDAGRHAAAHDHSARPNDPAWYKGGLCARRHADQHAGAVVHVLVRRVGGAEPRDLQPRAEDGEARRRRPAVGDHRAGRALLLHPRHRRHRRRRAQHGRRALRLPRHHLRVLRPVPEGRQGRAPGHAAEGAPTSRWARTSGRRRTRGRPRARSR